MRTQITKSGANRVTQKCKQSNFTLFLSAGSNKTFSACLGLKKNVYSAIYVFLSRTFLAGKHVGEMLGLQTDLI